jgi:HlyD family secretion protein
MLSNAAGEARKRAVPVARPGVASTARTRVLVALAVLAVLALGAAYVRSRAARVAIHYTTVAASVGAVAPAVLSSGTVNPVTTIQVGSYVSGVIRTISCDFNTRVTAGQLCAQIDARPYQSLVEQAAAVLGTAQAQLDKDRAALANAQRVDARNRTLAERGFVSTETAETAASVLAQARAQVALDQAEIVQRQAQLRAARINLGYTDIVSPVDGTVVSRNVTQGQTVAASFQTPTLFLIATDLTRMQVDTSVSESDIGQVAAGNAATFTVSAFPERQFGGTVRQVRQAPQSVQNVVTYDVVLDVANADLALKPGMTASVRIVTRQVGHVLRVPDPALRYRPDGTGSGDAERTRGAQVWVLDAGRPRKVPGAIGLTDGTYAEITGGALRAGDAVIVAESGAAATRGAAAAPGLVPVRR